MSSSQAKAGLFSELIRALRRRKPVAQLKDETGADTGGGELSRSLGVWRVAMIGVGATIGTGIFVVLSNAVPKAGPSVIISFILAGITAALTALCYAELASTIPVSGSSYTYAYATLGEVVAFLVAACLMLEYGVAAAAVAVGWSEYLNQLLTDTTGWRLPDALSEGGWVNLPAVVLVALCCLLLVRGVSESATINAITVAIKVAVLLLFCAIAFTAFDPANTSPFIPPELGVIGIGVAASSVFFSYVGLDAVSTAAEEARNPRRTMPRAIFLSIGIVTTVYILVALAGVGAQRWTEFEGQEAGLALILSNITASHWPAIVFAAGAVVSIFGVTLTTLFGQTRILFAMGRDGLLPRVFHRVHPRRLTPVRNTLIVSLIVGALAGFVGLDFLADLTSMGALVAFTVVSIGVIVLRRSRPDLPRGFRVPGYPITPLLSVLACLYLISGLPAVTFMFFGIWAALAFAFYLVYSMRHSRLRNEMHGQRGLSDSG